MRKGTRVRFSSYNSAYPEGEYRILSVDSSTQITLDTPAGVTGTSKQFRCDVAPTLPDGYTFYRKLGTIISSSDPAPLRFARTYQKGRNVIVSETSTPPCVYSTSNTASGVMPTGLLALLNNSNSIRSVTVSFSFFQTTAGTTASSAYATFAGKNYYVVQGVLPVYYTTARFTFDNMACVNATTNGPLSQSLTLGTGASAILTSSLHEWEEDLRA